MYYCECSLLAMPGGGIEAYKTKVIVSFVGNVILNVLFSYGREFTAEPYIGHSIGPVAGYGVGDHCYTI